MLEHLMLMNVCTVEAGVTVLVLSVVTEKSEPWESPLALRPVLLQLDHVWVSC